MKVRYEEETNAPHLLMVSTGCIDQAVRHSACLDLGSLAKTTDGRADGDSSGGTEKKLDLEPTVFSFIKHQKRPNIRHEVSTTGHGLLAGAASPDAGSRALHVNLAAEGAHVLGVLGNFDLLDDLTERSTVTSTVLTNDSDLLCALGLEDENNLEKKENH